MRRIHPLTRIKATANQGVEACPGILKHRQTNPRSCCQYCSRAAGHQQRGISCRDKEAIAFAEGLLGQVIVEGWGQPLADHGDRAVHLDIDQAEAPPRWRLPPRD